MMTETEQKPEKSLSVKKDTVWLIYISLFISGLILLTFSFGYTPIMKIPARLGIAMIYSAVALLIGRNRPSGLIATGIIWITIIVTFFI